MKKLSLKSLTLQSFQPQSQEQKALMGGREIVSSVDSVSPTVCELCTNETL